MRREFKDKVRIAAFERAKGHCESCTARLVVGKFAYDHVIADALAASRPWRIALCFATHAMELRRRQIRRQPRR
jgi:hypothetical protein